MPDSTQTSSASQPSSSDSCTWSSSVCSGMDKFKSWINADPSHKSILGGAIGGGVGGLIILGVAFWYIIRWRREKELTRRLAKNDEAYNPVIDPSSDSPSSISKQGLSNAYEDAKTNGNGQAGGRRARPRSDLVSVAHITFDDVLKDSVKTQKRKPVNKSVGDGGSSVGGSGVSSNSSRGRGRGPSQGNIHQQQYIPAPAPPPAAMTMGGGLSSWAVDPPRHETPPPPFQQGNGVGGRSGGTGGGVVISDYGAFPTPEWDRPPPEEDWVKGGHAQQQPTQRPSLQRPPSHSIVTDAGLAGVGANQPPSGWV